MLKCFKRKKYFTHDELNKLIKEFPYRWPDKSDSPQAAPLAFSTRKTVAGNAHENWALLRLLPLIVGERIPETISAGNKTVNGGFDCVEGRHKKNHCK